MTLLPQMLEHYRSLGIQSFLVYVHLQSEGDAFLHEVQSILHHMGIRIAGYRSGDWLDVQYQFLNEAREKYKSDWFVIADQDEFQIYPSSIEELLDECVHRGCDYVRGCFVDRFTFDGSLGVFDTTKSLWEQFPIGGLFTYPILGGDPRKIVLTNSRIAFTNSGHHEALQGIPYPIERCLVQVHHFKWMSGLVQYLKSRRSQRWPDGAAVNLETARLMRYLEENANKIDLEDPRISAALCNPFYPHWDTVVRRLGKVAS